MKSEKTAGYDWATAVLSVAQCESNNIRELVSAAHLDAAAGDISDFDFSDMDLSGQDMSNWDLTNAVFTNARVTKTNFLGSKLNIDALLDAEDWVNSQLDEENREDLSMAAVKNLETKYLELSVRTADCLRNAGLIKIGDITQNLEEDLLAIPDFGRKSLNELKEVLGDFFLSPDRNSSDLQVFKDLNSRNEEKMPRNSKWSFSIPVDLHHEFPELLLERVLKLMNK